MKHFILLIVSYCFALPLWAQDGLFSKYAARLTMPPTYVCYRTTTPIKIDGILDDEAWKKAPETGAFVDISGTDFPAPKYLTNAKMLWDDEYLYVAATLSEPDLRATLRQRDTIIYRDNDFEVFIDPYGHGQDYFEIETNAFGTVFDLLLDKPYRNGGNFIKAWDCPGLKLGIHLVGTINNSQDTDKEWTVEMAIPSKAVTVNFANPLVPKAWWRINFSRVEWLKKGGPEENWVWAPTGKIDMHMPERWGFLYFSPQNVGTTDTNFTLPYDMNAYFLLWALFYAQMDYHSVHHSYFQSISDAKLTNGDLNRLPKGSTVELAASQYQFRMAVTIPAKGTDGTQESYVVDNEGRFRIEQIKP